MLRQKTNLALYILLALWNAGCIYSLEVDKRVDVCSILRNPCLNNGTCVVTNGRATCLCGQGLTGLHCETRLDCSSKPCKNNGTCRNETSGYSCLCQKPYNGTNCENVCEDTMTDCFYYDNDKCVGIYASWAKQHCAHRCGYCQDKPKCVDKISFCSKLDINDCTKPDYVGYMRTNCRKTCNFCLLPDVYGNQKDGINSATPSELPVSIKTPERYGDECVDQLGDKCLDYSDDKCYGIYSSWAQAHCAVRCGYCIGLEPPCIDRINYCDAYSQNTCLDPTYARWARLTCRKFCGKCQVPTQVVHFTSEHPSPTPPTTLSTASTTPATTQTTYPTIQAGPNCLDKIQNCIDYVDESCIGVFQYWAMVNCPRRCGYCTDTHACMDYVKGCSHLPNVCNAPEYEEFARTNCRRHCKFCNATNSAEVSSAVTIPILIPTSEGGFTVKPRPMIDGHMGKIFWMSFPQTLTYSSSVKLQYFVTTDVSSSPLLHVNASMTTTSVLMDKKHPSSSMTYTNEQRPNTVEQKGILVSSNTSVALYTFSSYGTTHSDISWVPPLNKLGTSYIAASYHPNSYYSFISIIATQPDTTVTVLLNSTGTVTYNGITYHDGETILLYLTQYLSFQVSSRADLTGSKITSNRPISVQSGVSQFLAKNTGGSYSAASIYLPPVNKWGKTFVVPPIQSAKRYILRIVISEKPTSLSIISETGSVNRRHVNASLELNYPADDTYVIECDKPCFVVQIPASESGNNVTSYMVTIPAVEQFSRDYNIKVGNVMSYERHYLSVMIKSDEVYGLLMNGSTIFSYDLDIKAINTTGTMWSVLSLKAPEGYHHISHISPYSVYGLISYGFGSSRSYGYVAGLNL